MIPSCDQTGFIHFHSSTTSGSAALMSLRILPRVSPRQSPSSAILSEMRSDADWPWLAFDFFMTSSWRGERTDRDVVSVRISQRKLPGSRARIHVRLFVEVRDKCVRPPQSHLVVVDAEEQEEAVAGLRVIGARQGGMLMGAPLVKAEQHGSIGVEDLTEVVMGRSRLRQAKQRLVPLEAPRHVAHPDDRPRAFHVTSGAACALAGRVLIANLLARQRTTQHPAYVADVKCSGAQRESTPSHGQYAERMMPIHVADYEEPRTGDQAKDPTCRTIEES